MTKRSRHAASILLVDDHPLVRKGLRALLETEGAFTVVGEAGDGETAVICARSLRPDVVVLDVSMPGMSGIETAARILAESPGSRIVTLSMHSEKRFVDDMLKAGAVAYVLKDSAPEDLVVAIRAALRGECFLSPPILGTVVSSYRAAVEGVPRPRFILQTKLHQPTLPADLVARTSLVDRLDAGRGLPLTLVSAPAGYGKSLLIASWLARARGASAWLALDAGDSDIAQFVAYVVAAVRRVFPDTCQETLRLASGPASVPVSMLAATLSNELDALEEQVVLVLDDYHQIDIASPVNELLQQLLTRPPGLLHLVLVTRRDPPIPLALLRARGQVSEIRMRDLRFDIAETRALFAASLSVTVDDEVLAHVEKELEGWVAGLRLVTLSLRKDHDASGILQHLRGGVQQAQQYLTHEAIAGQPPAVREWLLKTAILDRFCASLCAAVCADDGAEALDQGEAFVRTLKEENLFVFPLDEDGRWFRFHQLFQELLVAELKREAGGRVAELHGRASEWFDREGFADESMKHALAAGDVDRAAEVAARHAQAVMAEGRLHVVARWLSQLPVEVVQARPGLLRAEAWRLFVRGEHGSLSAVLDRLEGLIDGGPDASLYLLETAALRGWCSLLANEPARALQFSEEALASAGTAALPSAGALAELVLGLAGQMQGERERVSRSLTRWLVDRSARDSAGEIRLTHSLAFMSYIAADPPGAEALVDRSRRVARSAGHGSLIPISDYLDGLFKMQRGEFEQAAALLGGAKQLWHMGRVGADGMCAQVLAWQALGEPERAADLLRALESLAREQYPWFQGIADACGVRLALLQGRAEAGAAWTRTSGAPDAEAMLWWFEIPALTWCRALLAEASRDSVRQAEERLRAHLAINEAQHNARQSVSILCLLALALAKQDKREEADAALQQALSIAEPAAFLFPFIEAGRPMADLLRESKAERDEFIERVTRICQLRAVPAFDRIAVDGPTPSRPEGERPPSFAARVIVEALTNRELDILELLAERFQNKEIAARLAIAPETVNYHLKHIYQKLNVQSRRQAVTAAAELGLLGERPGRPESASHHARR